MGVTSIKAPVEVTKAFVEESPNEAFVDVFVKGTSMKASVEAFMKVTSI